MCERCYEEVVDRAVKRGRLPASAKDAALRLFESDPTTARELIEALPTSAELAYENTAIRNHERELAHRMGVRVEDLL
jgi:hypothetical protein